MKNHIKKLCIENNIADIKEFTRFYLNTLSYQESDESRVKRYKEEVYINCEI